MAQGLYDNGFIINYKEGDQGLYRNFLGLRGSVNDIYHTIKEGETLYSIALKRYGDSSLWYIIADVNDIIEDIFDLPVNQVIVIPSVTLR